MRVLHVIPSLASSTGGTAAFVVQTSRSLAELEVDSIILTTDIASPVDAMQLTFGRSADLLPPHSDEVAIQFFPVERPIGWCYSPRLGAAVRAELSSVDVVHIHSLNLYPQFTTARVCQAVGKPYIVSPHGALEPFLRSRNKGRKLLVDNLWQRKMLNKAAAVHATSAREAELVKNARVTSRIAVGPFGMDLELFVQAGQRRSPEKSAALPVTILNHGRLHPKKGLDVAVRAMPQLLNQFPNARLELIGPDDTGYGAELEIIAQDLGVAEAIVRVGQLSGIELAQRVAAADIWILPSKGENFGVAVAEAMSAGVPVLTTQEVDFSASAASEGAAVLSEASPSSFANAIANLLKSPEQTALIAARGRRFAQNYELTAVAPRMKDFYASVVQKS